MKFNTTVSDYYNNYDKTKNYGYFIFIAGNPLQSAELNEYQDTVINQQKLLNSILLENGTILSGGETSVSEDNVFTIKESYLYTNRDTGYISYIPESSITISNYPETVGVVVRQLVITGTDDESLLEPYQDSPNYGEEGSYRVKFYTQIITKTEYYTNNQDTEFSYFIPIITINSKSEIIYIANDGDLNKESFLKRLNNIDTLIKNLQKEIDDLNKELSKKIDDLSNEIPDVNDFYKKSGDTLTGDMQTDGKKFIDSGAYSSLFASKGLWYFSTSDGKTPKVTINVNSGSINLFNKNSYIKSDNYYAYENLNFQSPAVFKSSTYSIFESGILSNTDIKIQTVNKTPTNNYIRTSSFVATLSPSRPENLTGNMFYEEYIGDHSAWILQSENKYFHFNSRGEVVADIFNGVAVKARYGDLAENYIGDKVYKIGTVMAIGGVNEVTSTNSIDDICCGVISENPGLIIHSEIEKNRLCNLVAIAGKVKVRVKGVIPKKGSPIYVSDVDGVGTCKKSNNSQVYFALSLEEKYTEEEQLVLCKLQGVS